MRQACGDDTDLFAEVYELLACHADEEDPLESPLPWSEEPPIPATIGPFRVLGLIGRGGMGIVYRAQSLIRDDENASAVTQEAPVVALKVLRAGLVTSQLERRFEREIAVLRRFDHSSIAKLLDAGNVDGEPYLVTELVEGLTLSRWRSEVEPALADRCRLLVELCEAVHYAHGQGVIHRDLKPDNILVTSDGHPKVLDFGIARLSDGDIPMATLATQTWQLLGTIRYMSPEQATGGSAAIDARSDVYALGVIAFELLTGELPYKLSRLSTPRALLEITAAEPSHLAAGDEALDLIVRHALEKDPRRRYQTAAAMADDLRRHLAGQSISQRRPGPVSRLRQKLHSRPRLRRWGLGLSMATLAGVAMLLLNHRTQPAPTVSWAGLYYHLEEADQLRHSGPHTRENFLAAAEIFRRARVELLELPAEPYTADLNRYIKWRLGELYYFIGDDENDAAMLEQARGCWRDAASVPWTPGSALGIDPQAVVRGRVMRLGSHQAQQGMGMAYARLAELQSPATNLRRAVEQQRWALISLDHGDSNYHGPIVTADDRILDRAYALLNSGSALTSLGAIVDSLGIVENGLAALRAAGATGGLKESGSRSMLEEALGMNFFYRAGLQPSEMALASLDSALAHLSRAFSLRGRDAGRTNWNLMRTMGKAVERTAEFTTDSGQSSRALRLAANDIRSSFDPLHLGADDLQWAQSDADLAVVVARLAAMNRDEPGFVRADSLLSHAAIVLLGDRYPVPFAEFSLRRAQVQRLQKKTLGTDKDVFLARKSLYEAGRAIPAVEWPALHRRIEAELVLLSTPPR